MSRKITLEFFTVEEKPLPESNTRYLVKFKGIEIGGTALAIWQKELGPCFVTPSMNLIPLEEVIEYAILPDI